jgi:hypothetical protein
MTCDLEVELKKVRIKRDGLFTIYNVEGHGWFGTYFQSQVDKCSEKSSPALKALKRYLEKT